MVIGEQWRQEDGWELLSNSSIHHSQFTNPLHGFPAVVRPLNEAMISQASSAVLTY